MPRGHTNSVHIAIVGVLPGMLACSDGDNRTVSLTPSSVVTHGPTVPAPPITVTETANETSWSRWLASPSGALLPSLDVKLATVLIVVALVGLPACNRTEPAPASPFAPTTGVVTTAPITVSGIVSEDGIPIANARVTLQFSCGVNCATGSEGLTDAAGRYAIGIRDLAGAADVWATAHKDGYVQRCVATTTALRANTSIDVRLTSIANSIAPLVGAGFSAISGTVFEGSATRRPVEGVYVTLSGGSYVYDEFAYTITDTSGRYLICGLPQERTYLTATKAGYKALMRPPRLEWMPSLTSKSPASEELPRDVKWAWSDSVDRLIKSTVRSVS